MNAISLARGQTTTRGALASFARWPARRWAVAAVAAPLAALVMGVPTGIIHTSLYTRMTPVRWWDYPVWTISAALVGLTAATYLKTRDEGLGVPADRTGRTLGATLLSTFAVGCPICNKLVVGLIGVSGALTYWAPLQPILGLAGIALLAIGLLVRLRGLVACRVPQSG